MKKIITFASRFGKNGELVLKASELKGWKEKRGRKNKIILFVSSEKISTFALPTEREGKKNQVADVMAIRKTRLKQTKNKLRRIRLKRTEV